MNLFFPRVVLVIILFKEMKHGVRKVIPLDHIVIIFILHDLPSVVKGHVIEVSHGAPESLNRHLFTIEVINFFG